MKRKKYYEPDVLNTPIIMLALSDEFIRAAGKAGFETFQQMVDRKDVVLDGRTFPVSLLNVSQRPFVFSHYSS